MSTINIKDLQQKKKETKDKSSFKNILNKEITLFEKGISDKQKMHFYQQLHLLLEAGLDLKSALELHIEGVKNKKQKAILQEVKDVLIEGSSLSEAMLASKKYSNYECFSIKIGEETGQLSVILKELSLFFQNKIKQRQLFISVLSYPALVFGFSLTAVIFMMNFIVPIFSDIFKRFGKDLPWLTQQVINISDFFHSTGIYLLIATLLIIALLYKLRTKAWLRKLSATLILSMPIIGKIIRKIYIVQTFKSLSLLIKAQVPLLKAIDFVSQMIQFYPIQTSLNKCKKEILKGHSFHNSLSESSIYNSQEVALVKVGEATNKLDLIFDQMSDSYQKEIEHEIGLLGTVLEPVFIILIGLFVGSILIAMYLPMFQLGSSMGL